VGKATPWHNAASLPQAAMRSHPIPQRGARRRRRAPGAVVLGVLLAARAARVLAGDDGGGGDDEELARLQSMLGEQTAIATKTKLNRDYVPGMVTVLDGREMEDLGMRTVWEALSLVPGVQAVRGAFSDPSVLVRSVNFIF